MNDRLFSLFLLALALLYGTMGLQIDVPFSYDPLGPKPVPLFIAGTLVVLSIFIMLRPKFCPPDNPDRRKGIWLFAILLFYQATWVPLGFLLSTTISVYLTSRQFQCSWMQGLMVALIISVACYGLFNFVLQVPLPLGHIFSDVRG